jgi:5'-phosphate synthase pdxT subunit
VVTVVASDPVVGVLALQGDVREHMRMLGACGVAARPVRRVEDLIGVDALVIPGGESTTMSKLAVEYGLLEPVRDRIGAGMPAFGSCAGMIMLAAEVLDGRPDQRGFGGIDMTVRRNAFGRQVDSFEAPVAVDGVGTVEAVFIRAPWVERTGPAVRVLGRVAPGGGPNAVGAGAVGAGAVGAGAEGAGAEGAAATGAAVAGRIVAVRQGNLLATAFHPELTGDPRIHRLFVDLARVAIADRSGVSRASTTEG